MICPFCKAENIDGADVCESCQESLDFLSQPHPETPVERSLLRDQVALITPRRKAVTVTPDTPTRDVLDLLVEKDIGCVVVSDGGQVAGIFSERDALRRLNVQAAQLGEQPISQFMTPSPETIDHDAELAFALHKMDVGGYRHLPVLQDGAILGVISIRDILRYVTEHLVTTE